MSDWTDPAAEEVGDEANDCGRACQMLAKEVEGRPDARVASRGGEGALWWSWPPLGGKAEPPGAAADVMVVVPVGCWGLGLRKRKT